MTVKFATGPAESENGPASLGGAGDLPGKELNCLRSLKMNVLPSTPFYQSYHYLKHQRVYAVMK